MSKPRAHRLFQVTGIQPQSSAAKRVATNAPHPIVRTLHHVHSSISEGTPFQMSSFQELQELNSVTWPRKHCTNVFRTMENCWNYSLSFQVSIFCINVLTWQEEPRDVQYLALVLSSFQKGSSKNVSFLWFLHVFLFLSIRILIGHSANIGELSLCVFPILPSPKWKGHHPLCKTDCSVLRTHKTSRCSVLQCLAHITKGLFKLLCPHV